MKPVLAARKILSVIRSGSSRPVVVEATDGKRYLVRLNGGLSHPLGNICDWVACKTGRAIGLPALDPQAIAIGPGVDTAAVDEEVRDLIGKSPGLNLAYAFYENAVSWQPEPRDIGGQLMEWLFLFDLFLLNVDRSPQNSNMIRVGKHLFTFDYESCFLLMGAAQGKNYFDNEYVLRQLRLNPLYQEIGPGEQRLFWSVLRKVDMATIVGSVPPELIERAGCEPYRLKKELKNGISEALYRDDRYSHIMDALKKMTPETNDERLLRMLENRERFEREMKMK